MASQDKDELKAKQRESRIKYYNKQKLLKQQQQQEIKLTDEDNKVAIYMDMFDKIFKN